jgi:hypothetical protein
MASRCSGNHFIPVTLLDYARDNGPSDSGRPVTIPQQITVRGNSFQDTAHAKIPRPVADQNTIMLDLWEPSTGNGG